MGLCEFLEFLEFRIFETIGCCHITYDVKPFFPSRHLQGRAIPHAPFGLYRGLWCNCAEKGERVRIEDHPGALHHLAHTDICLDCLTHVYDWIDRIDPKFVSLRQLCIYRKKSCKTGLNYGAQTSH